MKSISARPIFNFYLFNSANHRRINSHFLSFSTVTHHQSPFSGHHPRRHEEESRAVRVSVWWDFENCNLPINSNVFRVAQCVTNAVRANGIKGPIQITAFGDVMQISRTNQEALSSTGIILTHVPSGGKNSADRSLLVDLMYWVSQNPPPAHLFLISGDRDFAGILHRLRMNNYNILLASPDSAPSVLCSAATIMWQWSSLLKGENLTGKLFNQPPDGPYNSWYGHYKAPLEDPFAITDQPSCLHADESSSASELVQDSKVRPIPKAVMKHIRHILNSNPEGIAITQLRAELTKGNTIDKDLYGYKKLTRFLLAMPHILKLHPGSDGQFIVQGINNDSVPAICAEPVTNNGESEVISVLKPNCERSSSEDAIEKLPDPKMKARVTGPQETQKEEKRKEPSQKRNMQELREQVKKVKLKQQPKNIEVASPDVEKNENQVPVTDEHSSSSEFGILKRTWMKLFGSGDNNSSENDSRNIDETLTEKDNNNNEKNLISSQSAESMSPALFSPSSHETLVDGKFAKGDEAVLNTSSQDSGFFKRAMSWFKFWSPSEVDDRVEKNSEKVDQREVKFEQPEIFSKESFWNELESFIDTSQGAAPFFQSRTRAHLAQNLQKQGPPILKSLPEGDLLHLVDLLISDKKWVDECNSRAFPFRLTQPTGKGPHSNPNNPPSSSNGLRHIFSGKQQNLRDSGERKPQNPPHTGVPQPVTHRGSSSKPRSEILADCQKLVDHILKEYPEGFNIGSFRKLFLEKNGYALDLQKLGHDKLVNLLQIMPRVRIESNLILRVGIFKNLDQQNIDHPLNQESKSLDAILTKDDDSDSTWDELGPVDNMGPTKDEKDSRKGQKGRMEKRVSDYEPLEEDDFSDSEEETSSSVRSENERRSKSNEDESSLLQILDSWYSGKEETSSVGTKNESHVISPVRKQKPSKSYSFVAEQPVDSKDKLVDGILGSLKKSGERSVESRELS
ncbi:hypothetical protein BUALT_Bualt04G0010600 [Buddleja alternifolia]|uniref:HTH OST-type domain-containing protein n=1 Tax=Buddleja alternifolia TaxID=168488 RepID=A0AAV6XTJ8_9LAMI|nr:hypothetical protein BUALT_Bualt04G0010600 [Buddleja alternifolia]